MAVFNWNASSLDLAKIPKPQLVFHAVNHQERSSRGRQLGAKFGGELNITTDKIFLLEGSFSGFTHTKDINVWYKRMLKCFGIIFVWSLIIITTNLYISIPGPVLLYSWSPENGWNWVWRDSHVSFSIWVCLLFFLRIPHRFRIHYFPSHWWNNRSSTCVWVSTKIIQREPVKYRHFLAATKQLYEWYFLSVCPSVRPSVRLSVCHTFLTMFPSSYHHEIFRSYHLGPG